MKHYGDITKLSGYTLPIVDVITGGSPCQDLSVAGKRAGLAGERSGLFMEQMRIVKEMRERDVRDGRTAWAVRPRYMVWENVPGAFSSGTPKGSDFAAVIEEIVKVCQPGACVHVPVPDGGWTKSGCYYAEDGSWSIAWRVHDAQFWGVPQRRKRIALVADFGGLSAPEILFERKGLSRDPEPGEEAGKAAAGATGSSAGSAEPILLESNQNHATIQTDGVSTALPASMGMGGGYVPMVTSEAMTFQERGGKPGGGKGILIQKECAGALAGYNQRVLAYGVGFDVYNQSATGEVSKSLNSAATDSDHIPCVMKCLQNTGQGWWNESEVGATIRTPCGGDSTKANLVFAVDCRNAKENASINWTLQAKSNGGTSYNLQNVCRTEHVVRRLTPLECERLQGYPDGWTDIGEWTDSKGKKHKDADSPRYKALGNSIALPFWQYLARRICAQYERNITMASLFDGIGGFPLVFQRCGATPVWASEIEGFPIAVTKKHFPEE